MKCHLHHTWSAIIKKTGQIQMTWVLPLNNQTNICLVMPFCLFFFFFLFAWSFMALSQALLLPPLRYAFVEMLYLCFNVWNTGVLHCTLLVYTFCQHSCILGRKLSNSTINFYLLWQCTLRVNMIFYINTLKASTVIDLKNTDKLITLLINMAWQLKDLSRYAAS